MITSRSNHQIKKARSLRQRKARRQSGLFLVEGIFQVSQALSANAPVEQLICAPDLVSSAFALELREQALASGITVLDVNADVFASLSEKSGPQGLMAVLRQQAARLDSLSPRNFSPGVALVSPQDPGNLGTILRTLDAAGAGGVILLDGGVDPWHPTAVRASMGALFWQPLVQTGFSDFKSWADRHGYHLYGTSARGDADYRSLALQDPAILLFGSEQEGLSQEQQAACARIISLPMRGHVRSLNLGVAAGILIYSLFGPEQSA